MLKLKDFKIIIAVGIVIDIILILIMEFLPYMTNNKYIVSVFSGIIILFMISIFNFIDYNGHFCKDNILVNIIGFISITLIYLVIWNAESFNIFSITLTVLLICLIILLSLRPLWVVD